MSITDAGLINQLISYGYLVIFPLAMIEGPIISIIAGFLSSLGYFNLITVYLVIVTGDLLADFLFYLAGRYGGRVFIKKWGHYVRMEEERIYRLEKLFADHPGKTLITGKIAHGLGGAVLLAAGLANMRFSRFVLYNILSTIPKSLILVLVGYYFGRAYTRITKYLDYAEIGSIMLALTLVIIYIIVRKRARIEERKNI